MVVDGRAVDLDGDGFGEVLAAVTTLESPPDRPLALLRTHGRVLDGRTGAERWRP